MFQNTPLNLLYGVEDISEVEQQHHHCCCKSKADSFIKNSQGSRISTAESNTAFKDHRTRGHKWSIHSSGLSTTDTGVPTYPMKLDVPLVVTRDSLTDGDSSDVSSLREIAVIKDSTPSPTSADDLRRYLPNDDSPILQACRDLRSILDKERLRETRCSFNPSDSATDQDKEMNNIAVKLSKVYALKGIKYDEKSEDFVISSRNSKLMKHCPIDSGLEEALFSAIAARVTWIEKGYIQTSMSRLVQFVRVLRRNGSLRKYMYPRNDSENSLSIFEDVNSDEEVFFEPQHKIFQNQKMKKIILPLPKCIGIRHFVSPNNKDHYQVTHRSRSDTGFIYKAKTFTEEDYGDRVLEMAVLCRLRWVLDGEIPICDYLNLLKQLDITSSYLQKSESD